MEEGLYFLETLVQTNTTTARFDLSLSTLSSRGGESGGPCTASLSCLDLYAKPLETEPDETGSVSAPLLNWRFKLKPLPEIKPAYTGSLGSLYQDPAPTLGQALSGWQERHQAVLDQKFSYAQSWPSLSRTSLGKVRLYLPPGWQLLTNDANFFLQVGLIPVQPEMAKASAHGPSGLTITNNNDKLGIDLYGKDLTNEQFQSKIEFSPVSNLALNTGSESDEDDVLQLELSNEPSSTIINFRSLQETPSEVEFDVSVSNSSLRHQSRLKTLLAHSFRKALSETGLNPSLLIVTEHDRLGHLNIESRQDMGELPLRLELSWNEEVKKTLGLGTTSRTFYLGHNRYSASSLDHVQKMTLGPIDDSKFRKQTISKRANWSNPLHIMAPFSVVTGGHTAQSYISGQGFCHVLAYVSKSLRVNSFSSLHTLTKDNTLTLRFFNSDLQPCTFLEPFRLFMVLRVKPAR